MRRRLVPLALTLVMALAACGDGTGPEPGIDGVYTLKSINGNALPWIAFQIEQDKIEVLSGSITLRTDGSFTDLTTYRITESGVSRDEQDVYTGTFLETATGATLSPIGFEPYVVAIAGGKLTQIIGEFTLEYAR